MIKNVVKRFLLLLGYRIESRQIELNTYFEKSAWDYQSKYILPHYQNMDVVIDIGSGGAPSPIANILTDYYPDQKIHRTTTIVEDRPLVVCSVERMPFKCKVFDISICAHVLEHVPNPILAIEEIGRISKAGYLETPAYGKDILIGTGYQHIWQVVSSGETLHFFPYTARQHEAHADSPFMNIWCQSEYHPFQRFFWERQDLFNAIQFWTVLPRIVIHSEYPEMTVAKIKWKPIQKEKLPDLLPDLTDDEIDLLEKCLSAPNKTSSMHYRSGSFWDETEEFEYPVRGKRIYCEIPDV